MITVTGDYCAFFSPEELSQLEHLIRHQRKEEFPLSVFVPESKRVSQGGEGEGEGGNRPLTVQMISQSSWNCTRTKIKYRFFSF